jgi:hypothetical protein
MEAVDGIGLDKMMFRDEFAGINHEISKACIPAGDITSQTY